jgi:hypothetical protein
MAVARFTKICIDANDPLALGRFWADVIGYELEEDDRPADQREAGLVADEQWRVWFNRVPQAKQVKNRVHLDIYTRALADLEALGATALPTPDGVKWTIMADPEGGEFCAFVRETPPAYKLYEVCVDTAAGAPTAAIARWWGDVFGVDAATEDGKEWWWIEKLPGVPFDGFSFVDVPEGKTTKNRVHWDVTGDKDALLAAGATMVLPIGEGRGWDVLADPDGNEFCVFAPRGQ